MISTTVHCVACSVVSVLVKSNNLLIDSDRNMHSICWTCWLAGIYSHIQLQDDWIHEINFVFNVSELIIESDIRYYNRHQYHITRTNHIYVWLIWAFTRMPDLWNIFTANSYHDFLGHDVPYLWFILYLLLYHIYMLIIDSTYELCNIVVYWY